MGSGFGVPGSGFLIPDSGKQEYWRYFVNTRKAIPEILRIFEKYEVHATWAAVGMLMNKSREELVRNSPAAKPAYINQSLSAYQYIDTVGIGKDESEDPFHYAPSLVDRIVSTKNQELGTHTYSHFYCNEPGQTPEQFRSDLQSAKIAANAFGVTLKSLVFPRNQFNDDYLKVCFEEGIQCVRTNPADWWWRIDSTQDEGSLKRLSRGMDAYIPLGKKNTYKLSSIERREGYPVCLPASRLLRPYRPNEFFLNRLKINRVKGEMESAARAGEVYHLWWHPHNFGWYPKENLEGLEVIFRHYEYCREKYGMESLTMGETADLLNA